MAFILLQRPLLANTWRHHQSLPLTSLRWQQHRRISVAVLHRINKFISVLRRASTNSSTSAFENELQIVERRRQELEYLLDAFTKESLYSMGGLRYELRWLDRLQDAIEFYYKESRLPTRGATGDEGSLAQWISDQRKAKHYLDKGKPSRNKITSERIATLESMSWWVWDVYEAAWKSSFAGLVAYVENYGKLPPRSHPTLGNWVDTQRTAYRAWQSRLKGEKDRYTSNHYMDEERAANLESLPCWSWEPHEDNWEAKYQELVEYVRKNNRIPPQSHPALGVWIHNQGIAYRAWQAQLKGETEKYNYGTCRMDEERATKLEAVPHWKWNIYD